jgi:hypothetical protein
MEARDLGIETDLVAEAEQCLRRLARLCDACDDYLRHPEDPDRYDLSPRVEEIMVTYSDDGGPRKRASVSDLLARVPGAVRRDRVELETAGRPLGPAPPLRSGIYSRPRTAPAPRPTRRPHCFRAGVQSVHQP